MLPGPLLASPPLTDQVTLAAPPLESVAVNCSTEAPAALVALQAVQLVSMRAVEGEMEKAPLEELAVTAVLPQPETTSSRAGTKANASTRNGEISKHECRREESSRFKPDLCRSFVTGVLLNNALVAFLGVTSIPSSLDARWALP